MRKWHRWISVFFAVIMLWVAITGVLSYVAAWWPASGPAFDPSAVPQMPEGATCPEGWRCFPAGPPPGAGGGMRSLVGFFHHLHSGEEFGIVGEIIVFLSGIALTFFAISGMWMYVQMWKARASRGAKSGLFWK